MLFRGETRVAKKVGPCDQWQCKNVLAEVIGIPNFMHFLSTKYVFCNLTHFFVDIMDLSLAVLAVFGDFLANLQFKFFFVNLGFYILIFLP